MAAELDEEDSAVSDGEIRDRVEDLILGEGHLHQQRMLRRRRRRSHGMREDSLQFFKEVRDESAVYNVYLKKVRYNTSNDDGIDEGPEDSKAQLQWRLEEVYVIRQGTLTALVHALGSSTGDIDSTYVNTFLATYRSFSTAHEVMTILLDRYKSVMEDESMKQQLKEGHQKTIRTVTSVWLDLYPDDFKEPSEFPTLHLLIDFAKRYMPESDLQHRASRNLSVFHRDEDPEAPISVDDITLSMQHNMLQDVDLLLCHASLARPLEFKTIDNRFFAEQLTYIDSELFKRVQPHHCLGSVWSRRDKKRGGHAESVYKTVNQFNAVSYRVIATVLKHPSLCMEERALVIDKWIEIAQELRVLKNFSSLKAIISGLQSNPVYRLKSVWALVDKDKMDLFNELSEIFSDDNNQLMAREVLNREGTAKFADPETCNTIRGHRRNKSWGWNTTRSKKSPIFDIQNSTVQGTVPYLGTFLTDLTMIDTAIKDCSESGLINFDKKRKEFEYLAQIKLLQSAAQLYHMRANHSFFDWFYSIRIYDDNESYELSCEIEPANPALPREVKGHRRKSSLGFFSPRRPSQSLENLHVSESSPSICSEDGCSVISNPECLTPPSASGHQLLRHSVSVGSLRSMEPGDISTSPWHSPETMVAKVFLETSDNHFTNHYKSILLANSDHTRNVIRSVLLKYALEASTDDFVLYQILDSGKEIQLPEKGNLFYAITTGVKEVQFLMRKKSDVERIKSRHLKSKARRKKLTL
ncbi:hypothetical protein CAPTEDRAFT_226540 [Capitella teleta]|uniref:Ras-GEF domain-containing protein n=1 Tax=Capitella teleta TaxID=283909 RepID=R7TZ37_CAPTE|nr:hypothetical protein CAPTEDRAFT_226540 [Capitella teleta]|eukprot:ELT96210.1 hypothetical protein CAPTEDRAFT_226540 [Capitella teleta]